MLIEVEFGARRLAKRSRKRKWKIERDAKSSCRCKQTNVISKQKYKYK